MLSINKWKRYFPLTTINDIMRLFESLLSFSKLENNYEPNISFISILLGLIEYKLTSNTEDDENQFENIFINNNGDYASVKILYITFTDVINLYKKFQMIISEIVPSKSLKSEEDKMLDRQILKSITDAVFMKLSVGKYKENCHSQSVYSFIQDNSLDSFGLSFTILAITQQLGYNNVWLSLSEDHAWLEYSDEDVNNNSNNNIGNDDRDIFQTQTHKRTADVAWSGKNHEDKRCGSIDSGIRERSRLYLGGNSVVCFNNRLAAAAAITTINPVKGSHSLSLNGYSNRNQIITSCHSSELVHMKRDLLWMAYNMKLLKKYPLAIINLADLEMNYPKNTISKNEDYFSGLLGLYKEAIDINLNYYNNSHVYPYLSMANYFYKDGDFQRALTCWRLAANVISKYNYKSEDWIIYREFFEIATQFVPNIFRIYNKEDDHHSKSSGSVYHVSENESTKDRIKFSTDNKSTVCDELKNSVNFLSEFLCFFDFICLWEEGSSVPVLHEVWANKFKEVLCRFSENTRVDLNTYGVDAKILNDMQSIEEILFLSSEKSKLCIDQSKPFENELKQKPVVKSRQNSPNKSKRKTIKKLTLSNEELNQIKEFWLALGNNETKNLSSILSSKVLNLDFLLNSNSVKMFEFTNILEPIDYENLNCENLCQLEMNQGFIDYFSTFKSVRDILNNNNDQNKNLSQSNGESDQVLQELSNDQSKLSVSTKFDSGSVAKTFHTGKNTRHDSENNSKQSHLHDKMFSNNIPLIEVFKSQKMKDICPLIVAPGKLNVPAIKLPLTAQSQVSLKRTGLHSVYGSFEFSNTMSRKRPKRE